MKNIILAGILGGIAMFIWGAISWVVLPWHDATVTELPNEEKVIEAFQGIPTGIYYFPGMPEGSSQVEWETKHKRGPLGLVYLKKEGLDPMAASLFINGIILNIISALILSYLLSLVVNQLGSYSKRVIFLVLVGLLGAFSIYTLFWNWFYVSTEYTVVNILDYTLTTLAAALVIAWKIKPAI